MADYDQFDNLLPMSIYYSNKLDLKAQRNNALGGARNSVPEFSNKNLEAFLNRTVKPKNY